MKRESVSWLAIAPILCGIGLHAEPVFYAISGDLAGIPRQFDTISIVGAGSVSSPFNLGDSSVGFTGGLTYRASDNRFYTISPDGAGFSTLSSLSLAGGGAV